MRNLRRPWAPREHSPEKDKENTRVRRRRRQVASSRSRGRRRRLARWPAVPLDENERGAIRNLGEFGDEATSYSKSSSPNHLMLFLYAPAAAALSHSRAALSSPRLSSPVASAVQQPQKVVSLTPASAVAFARGEMQLVSVPCDADSDGCLAFCDAEECAVVAPSGVVQRLKVGGYFALWFLLSVGYSITNKRVTNALPCPWSVATATVVVGSLFVNLLWLTGLRRRPRLSAATYRALIPIGTFHAIGHIAGTVGTAAGSVSFAQVVKAAGPVYACVLSAAVLKQARLPLGLRLRLRLRLPLHPPSLSRALPTWPPKRDPPSHLLLRPSPSASGSRSPRSSPASAWRP